MILAAVSSPNAKAIARESEYRATFQCIGGGTKPTSYRQYYLIGFYDEDHRDLFMTEANAAFTTVKNGGQK